jgi:hypothetical protein
MAHDNGVDTFNLIRFRVKSLSGWTGHEADISKMLTFSPDIDRPALKLLVSRPVQANSI